MKIKIRPAKETDFAEIISLFKEFSIFEKQPEKLTNSVDRMLKEKDFFHCFVAEADQQLVGYVSYFFCYYTWTGKSLHMDDLYVQPDYRGMGIGTKFIDHVIDFAKESGCHRLRWQVSSWNRPAIDLYKSLGAEITDVEWNCDLVLDETSNG